jgi:hypothetical protein
MSIPDKGKNKEVKAGRRKECISRVMDIKG